MLVFDNKGELDLIDPTRPLTYGWDRKSGVALKYALLFECGDVCTAWLPVFTDWWQ